MIQKQQNYDHLMYHFVRNRVFGSLKLFDEITQKELFIEYYIEMIIIIII